MTTTSSTIDQSAGSIIFASRDNAPTKRSDNRAFDRAYHKRTFEEDRSVNPITDGFSTENETRPSIDKLENIDSADFIESDTNIQPGAYFYSREIISTIPDSSSDRIINNSAFVLSRGREGLVNKASGDNDGKGVPSADATDKAQGAVAAAGKSIATREPSEISSFQSEIAAKTNGAHLSALKAAGGELDPIQLDMVAEKPTSNNRAALSLQIDRVPSAQLAAAILRNRDGDRLEIALDPPELGRIRIDFDLHRPGSVKAVIYAENMHTFDLLRRNIDILKHELMELGSDDIDLSMGEQKWSDNNDDENDVSTHTELIIVDDDEGQLTSKAIKRTDNTGRIDRVI